MDQLPKVYTVYGGLAGVFAFIAFAMQFLGFFIIEPVWLGNIIGGASIYFYFMAATYYYAFAAGTKNALRNAFLIFLFFALMSALCYFYNPGIRPAVKGFFDRLGINLATGYKPKEHRGR